MSVAALVVLPFSYVSSDRGSDEPSTCKNFSNCVSWFHQRCEISSISWRLIPLANAVCFMRTFLVELMPLPSHNIRVLSDTKYAAIRYSCTILCYQSPNTCHRITDITNIIKNENHQILLYKRIFSVFASFSSCVLFSWIISVVLQKRFSLIHFYIPHHWHRRQNGFWNQRPPPLSTPLRHRSASMVHLHLPSRVVFLQIRIPPHLMHPIAPLIGNFVSFLFSMEWNYWSNILVHLDIIFVLSDWLSCERQKCWWILCLMSWTDTPS